MTTQPADMAMIGLAVMGENLVLNMESHGFTVAVYNRTVDKMEAFVAVRGKGKKVVGCKTIPELCAALKRPRKVMMLVKAGKAVDECIEQLLPHLEPGDIIIDGGNSHYPDTIRRTKDVESKGLLFIGTGVSGGEEGALKGPSIMPGGSPAAWPHVKPVFQAVSAKVEGDVPCCDWVGSDGAGHFVKMVHNGIEYGDMQMICEAYSLLKGVLGLTNEELHDVFTTWNEGDLDSYLIQITRDIFAEKDPETGKHVVDVILDTAGQKGTGKWTSVAALDYGVAAPTVSEAVFARCMSAMKDERVAAAKVLAGPKAKFKGDKAAFIEDVRQALYASQICSYAQGFQLMRAAAAEQDWKLDFGSIALMWRGGCIIRARFLGDIKAAFDRKPALANLLLDKYFKKAIRQSQAAWRRAMAKAIKHGVPVPAFSSALSYYDGYRTETLPANLLQAQRDYFGAHTYERVDKPRGQFFHTDWCKLGGSTTSSTYVV